MIDIKKILESMDDLYYVITDKDNNVLACKNPASLNIYRNIITNALSVNSISDNNVEYYLRDTNEWYEYFEKEFPGETLKIFRDITKYKIRERNLQIDQTTGLPNRKLTDNLLNECIEEAKNNDEEFAIIFCDIDFFKNVNDIYGHDRGDAVLNALGTLFKNKTRQNNNPNYEPRPLDITGRHGGEEFLLVLRNISRENAEKKAETIRINVQENKIKYEQDIIAITMTMGMYHVSYEELRNVTDIDEFRSIILRKADLALYEGKRTGRNKVVLYKNEVAKSKIRTKNK